MVIFVDVDDTFVRSFGTKRIPIPSVIKAIHELKARGQFCIVGAVVDESMPMPQRSNLDWKTALLIIYPNRMC
jgi:hypothetical protein